MPAPPAQQVGNSDGDVRFILRNLDIMDGADITVAEIRRAYAMMAAHNTTPQNVRATIVALDRPAATWPHPSEMVGGGQRRVDLAAMLGIAVGFEGATAQKLIDRARDKPLSDVVSFVVGEVAVLTVTSAGVYGACLAVGKGASTMAAKAGAIKAGGLGVTGTLKAGAMVVGGGLLSAGAAIGGLALGAWGWNTFGKVVDNHDDVIEPKFFKDQRILVGLQEGRIRLPNPSPVTEELNARRLHRMMHG